MHDESNAGPRLSVVMAIDRMDAYLQPAIQSVLAQSFQDFEFLIVVNERLREQHPEILRLCGHDPRVILLEAPALGGLALALNLGVAHSRSQYIARMDGDDISLPERFAQQVTYLDAHPDVMVLGCRVQLIGTEGKPLALSLPFYETDAQIRRQLPVRSPLQHPALLLRRSAVYAVGGYMFGRGVEDWELYLRMARLPGLRFHNLNELLFLYRRHPAQATASGRIRSNYLDIAAFLFSEMLATRSPAYAFGILFKHPLLSVTRRRLLHYVSRRKR
ncbi:MAG: glycosyltransferase [Acidobacteriota bacterium]|nr:glycosyltransferase [Acidobacteriota bacterium]